MFIQMFPLGKSLPDDRHLVGGKAAGLGDLCRAGAAVPKGAVIVISSPSPGSTAHAEQLISQHLRSWSPDGAKFAVRSSNPSEDGNETSYAGMYETYLNVALDDVWSAVEACVQATSSARVTAYQTAHEVSVVPATRVPIVIQQMVGATAAGVGFSIHPVSPSSSAMVVEAVHGLGDRLVSGHTTPDLYEIDTAGGLISFEPGDDTEALGESLDAVQLGAVAELMLRMRQALGYEVDVEFAFEGDQLFALQVRPITTLGSHMIRSGAA